MNALQTERNRLYHSDADGRVRALVLELGRPADWSLLSGVWQGVQADLQWPAPAIAVSGIDAYQLWFALGESISVSEAQVVLQGLCARYLGAVSPARIRLFPATDGTWSVRDVPELQPENQMWSAFVAPDLASIFANEPWLDVPPSPQAQASLLSQLACIKSSALQAFLLQAKPSAKALTVAAASAPPGTEDKRDPKRFLQDVMADTSVDMRQRVDAAIALLPYSVGG